MTFSAVMMINRSRTLLSPCTLGAKSPLALMRIHPSAANGIPLHRHTYRPTSIILQNGLGVVSSSTIGCRICSRRGESRLSSTIPASSIHTTFATGNILTCRQLAPSPAYHDLKVAPRLNSSDNLRGRYCSLLLSFLHTPLFLLCVFLHCLPFPSSSFFCQLCLRRMTHIHGAKTRAAIG